MQKLSIQFRFSFISAILTVQDFYSKTYTKTDAISVF